MSSLYYGVDVGGTSIKMGIVNEKGDVLSRREIRHASRPAGQTVMEEIIEGIRTHAEDLSVSFDVIGGIGVSAAGCINSNTGSVAENGGNVPGWSRTDVCNILEREFGVKATLANDANCAVLGEAWTGAARGYTDVVGVTLGTGVGGGIITGGKLLEGSRGYAGEIGHFPLHAGGEHCVCGLDGCFERYASTSALTRHASLKDPAFGNGKTLFEWAAQGDETARNLISEWVNEVAFGVAGLVHIFDPQIVLIGGGVSAQEELLIRPLRDKVLTMIMPDFAKGLEFRGAILGNDAGMVGAVRYLLSREEE